MILCVPSLLIVIGESFLVSGLFMSPFIWDSKHRDEQWIFNKSQWCLLCLYVMPSVDFGAKAFKDLRVDMPPNCKLYLKKYGPLECRLGQF